MLDLARLRVLRELKRRGTVSAVADALGYSPSAVSQQLAQLQKDVDVTLLEKVGRRLRLTEAGEVLAGHAETLLAQAQQAEEATLASCGQVAGTIRVIGFQTAVLNLVVPALPGLISRYPDLTVEIYDEEFVHVLQTLVMQEADVVLKEEYSVLAAPRRPELTAEVLTTEPVRVALPRDHRLASTEGPVSIRDLADCGWVTGHVATNHDELLERTCIEFGGFKPKVRHRTNDLLVTLEIVAAGNCVCLFPELAQTAREPGVEVREVADTNLLRQIVMWTREGSEVRPSIRAVTGALRSAADDLVVAVPTLRRGE